MGSSRKNTTSFDDDFEVTYEEDTPFMYSLESDDPKSDKRKSEKKTARPKKSQKAAGNEGPSGWDLRSTEPSEAGSGKYNGPDKYEIDRYGGRHTYEDYEEDYENEHGEDKEELRRDVRDSSVRKKKRRAAPTRLAAPIQKGGKTVYRISQSLLRNLSVILIFAIIALLVYNFLRGSAPYGDIQNAVSTQTYTQTLAAYFAVAALFVLYELISALWAMTKVRVRDQFGSHREDVGRGLFSFIFIYLCSYAAFLTNAWIPGTQEALLGVKGALDVFGSLHNALFGLCAAGVVSCLLRKYSLSL